MTDKPYPEKERPAVINHPVTGKPILFVNPMHVHGFRGMEKKASWELIQELAKHSTQDKFTYYHHWRVGDLVMWDEQATMIAAPATPHPAERRVMMRTIVYPN